MKERFETFTTLNARISHSIRRIKAGTMATFDLKSAHVSCIYYLYKAGKLTATELTDLCKEDKSAISRTIEYLEKNGYLVYKSRKLRRYKTPLSLTDKGNEIGKRLAEEVDAVLTAAGEGLSEENRLIMYQSLTTVCENLEKICERYE